MTPCVAKQLADARCADTGIHFDEIGSAREQERHLRLARVYGAANILQELLTVKSDDVDGRTKIYESMVRGENILEPGTPVSFEVLTNEIKGLGLNLKLEKQKEASPSSTT